MKKDKTKKPAGHGKQGRPSKLSPEQRETIRQRLVSGGKPTLIAREYGVDPKVIQRIKTGYTKEGDKPRASTDSIKAIAQKSLQNDLADPGIRPMLETMNEQDRSLFYAHKADLMEITLQLNMAARFSAQNAHKLSRMAQYQLSKLNEEAPGEDGGPALLINAAGFQEMANDAAKIPLKVFEIATKQPPTPPEDQPLRIIGGLPEVPYE
jgi:hypothetical protein